MPYKFETNKLKMKDEDKRNWKLDNSQKATIRKLYLSGGYSQRQLAALYNVSRRTIVFCIYPEKYQKSREDFKKRQKSGMYYDQEKQPKRHSPFALYERPCHLRDRR